MPKLNKYRVHFKYIQYSHVDVEAESADEAEAIVDTVPQSLPHEEDIDRTENFQVESVEQLSIAPYEVGEEYEPKNE